MRFYGGIVAAAVLTLLTVGCAKKNIQAGGSTFIHPMMNRWASEYEKVKGVRINYQAIGSGEGILEAIAKSLDFGCTDAPLTEDDLKKAMAIGGEILHIPLALGAVVPAYNLEKLQEPLRFTGPVLADIYLGKINRWSDLALKKLNPNVDFPDREIAVVHRADGSGTTYVWADYLAKVSPEWKAKVGVATTVAWPCGVAEPGNAGVTKRIKQTPGAIGYVELAFALQDKISFGLVQNKEGAFIKADVGTVNEAASAAVAEEDIPKDLRFSLTNRSGKLTYPISGATWAILYRDQSAAKGKLVMNFLRWVTDEGQQLTESMHYARFPQGLINHVHERLDQVRFEK